MLGAVLLMFLALVSTGCGSFKSEPSNKRKGGGALLPAQTGTNLRRLANPAPQEKPRSKQVKKKQETPKPKREKRPVGVEDENFTPRGGFR